MGNDRQISSDAELRSAVEARNELRQQAGLLLVDPSPEIVRAQQLQKRLEFEQLMQSPFRHRVEGKLLARIRRRTGSPNWKPTGVLSSGGWAFHAVLAKQMRRLKSRLG